MTTTPPQNDSGLIDGGLPEAALLPAGGIAQLFFGSSLIPVGKGKIRGKVAG